MKLAHYVLFGLLMPCLAWAQAPTYDPAQIPPGHPGFAEERIQPSPAPKDSRDATGQFRITCDYSHMNRDDPIIYPGQLGAAHLHSFFGNTGTDYRSTQSTIRNRGNSTCAGGIANRTAYWVPSMIDTRGAGTPLKPLSIIVYYKSGYHQMPINSIRPPPVGLKIVAGDQQATGPSPLPAYLHNRFFTCHYPAPLSGPDMRGETVPNCPVNTEVWMHIIFPQCWDGVNLDSADHKSHMAFRVGDAGGACPTTHPVVIPEVTFNLRWGVTEAGAATHWRLSSDHYPSTTPAGYSGHGDVFFGWQADVARQWNNNCVRVNNDCEANLIGASDLETFQTLY